MSKPDQYHTSLPPIAASLLSVALETDCRRCLTLLQHVYYGLANRAGMARISGCIT